MTAAVFGIPTVARGTATPATDFSATPDAPCTSSALGETTQGRAPAADYATGRAARGYMCNASQVSHVGASGGYRTYRYTDRHGRVCAYYDTTLLFPGNVYSARGDTGVWVLDMTDPAHPVHTATLSTPAMQSPHESFSINVSRGLLGAVMGNPAFHPGQFDLYSISDDCAHPALDASLPMGVLGHEGSFAPDGNTYYAASLFGHTMTAIDVSTVLAPRVLWASANWVPHGLNISKDGRTLYFADLGNNTGSLKTTGTDGTKGLTLLDVSQIQARVINPQVSVISHLTWPVVSTPQTDLPFTITLGSHKGSYLGEVDEFGAGSSTAGPVGAARIIDISHPASPTVVSNMRLAVDNVDLSGSGDPGASNTLQGYAAHYCSLSSTVNPRFMACSFIVSGLRLFDIHDPAHPVEVAYFNKPQTGATFPGQSPGGAYALSQPAFDPLHHQIWYADGNSGFYAVQIDPAVWPF